MANLTRLLITSELQRLARWLRLLGCDVTVYEGKPLAIYPNAFAEGRVIVTRNQHVRPSSLVRVIHLRGDGLRTQLKAITRVLKLPPSSTGLFARCGLCNTLLIEMPKPSVKGRVPPYVFQTQTRFTNCPSCRRIYWSATHHDRAREFLQKTGVLTTRKRRAVRR